MKKTKNEVTDSTQESINTFSYSYAKDYGQSPQAYKEIDKLNQKGKVFTQEQIDKHVDKGLTQVYKEENLAFPKLLAKIQQEMKQRLESSFKLERESRVNQLIKAQGYGLPERVYAPVNQLISARQYGLPEKGFSATEDHTDSESTRLILNQVSYSDLQTKQEHTKLSWTVSTITYTEQCTENGTSTNCTDHKLNGVYRQCKHELVPQKIEITQAFPFSQYWAIALGFKPQNTR